MTTNEFKEAIADKNKTEAYLYIGEVYMRGELNGQNVSEYMDILKATYNAK